MTQPAIFIILFRFGELPAIAMGKSSYNQGRDRFPARGYFETRSSPAAINVSPFDVFEFIANPSTY